MKGFVWAFLLFYVNGLLSFEKPFIILVCSYNNQKWVEKNLESLLYQNYSNYRIIYIDDCSTDNTVRTVQQYLKAHDPQHRCMVVQNKTRQYKLANLYHAIHHLCADDEIIVEVDGDDWLLSNSVLSQLNELYQSQNIWMTYGGFTTWPQQYHYLQAQPIPQTVIYKNQFRQFYQNAYIFLALRSFYAGLFKQIKKEDLLEDEIFFTTASDIATMIPMFEMAGERFIKINEPIYLYNTGTELNDFRRDRHGQKKVSNLIKNRPPYQRLAKASF